MGYQNEQGPLTADRGAQTDRQRCVEMLIRPVRFAKEKYQPPETIGTLAITLMADVMILYRHVCLHPSFQMRQQSAMYPNRWLAFVGTLGAEGSVVKRFAIEIHPAAVGGRQPAQLQACSGPGARIDADQEHPGDMLTLLQPTRCADAICDLFVSEPIILSRFRFAWEASHG